jgi:hypothetical protein
VGFWVELGLASFAEGAKARLELARAIVERGLTPRLLHHTRGRTIELRAQGGRVTEVVLPPTAHDAIRKAIRPGTDAPNDLLSALDFTDVLVAGYAKRKPVEVEAGDAIAEVGSLDRWIGELEKARRVYASDDGEDPPEARREAAVLVACIDDLLELARIAKEHALPLTFHE